MLTARKINKSYKSGNSRLQVLEGINIDVEKGEMLFVVGSSMIPATRERINSIPCSSSARV